MNTTLITILIFSLCSFSNIFSQQESDWSNQGFKGKVKSVETSKFKAIDKFGEFTKDKFVQKNIRIFNEKGYLIEQSFFDEFNNLITKIVNIYDSSQTKKIKSVRYQSNGVIDLVTIYKYNNNGLVEEVNMYDNKGVLINKWITKYTKTQKGIEEESIGYDGNGKVEWKTINVKDFSGNEIERSEYDAHNLLYLRKFNYDQNNNKIEFIHYNPDLSIDYRYVYLYVNNKQISSNKYNVDNKLIGKTIVNNDTINNLIETIVYKEDGSLAGKEINVYRDNKIIENLRYNKDNLLYYKSNTEWDGYGNKLTYTVRSERNFSNSKETYKYDKFNNLIEIRKFKTIIDKPEEIIEYKFVYY